jgi:hypothetical protein
VTTWWIGYGWPAAHGMNSEGLSVELVSAGHDKTAVRVDSQVTWILPRPASEVIPSGARTLTVSFVRPLAEPVAGGPSGVASGSASSGPATASSSGSPGSAPSKVPAGKSTTVTVTNLSKIRAIAAAIDALPLFPAGAMSCPMDNGEAMVLSFGSGHGGQPLAVVSVGTSGCDATAVTIGGKVQPALAGGELAVVVARALGLPIALLGGSVTAMPPVAGGTVPTSSPAG